MEIFNCLWKHIKQQLERASLNMFACNKLTISYLHFVAEKLSIFHNVYINIYHFVYIRLHIFVDYHCSTNWQRMECHLKWYLVSYPCCILLCICLVRRRADSFPYLSNVYQPGRALCFYIWHLYLSYHLSMWSMKVSKPNINMWL